MFSRYCFLVALNSAEGAHITNEDLSRVIEYIQASNSGNISLATLASIARVTPHHFAFPFTKGDRIEAQWRDLRFTLSVLTQTAREHSA